MNLYFGYSEEMNPIFMNHLAESAVFFGVGKLKDYRFVINKMGKATVEYSPQSYTYGIVWNISEEDFFHIEKFRQTSSSIDQCVVKTPITILRNPQNERLSYRVKHNRISSDVDCSLFKDSVHTIGNASEDYIRDITFSLSQFGIPQEYLQEIRFWSL